MDRHRFRCNSYYHDDLIGVSGTQGILELVDEDQFFDKNDNKNLPIITVVG